MSTLALLGIGAGSIALLLLLIIRWQVHAFVAMMVSFLVAFATGMPIGDIISTLIAGMGGTLGSVAILVALGSMLGRMIEVSGGAASLANRFTQLLGPKRVPMALTAATLVLAIPVFFDVGFIILVPIVYGFCKAAGVNPIKFGLPGRASCWPRSWWCHRTRASWAAGPSSRATACAMCWASSARPFLR